MSVFVGISPDNIDRLRPLLTLFWQQLVDLNVRLLPELDPEYRHPALLCLDEFPVLGAMTHLASAFAYIAGYGLRAMLVCQSPAQLSSPLLYGPELASVILDNCGVECVFGTKNRNVAEDLSARIGDQTVQGITINRPRFGAALKWDKQSEAQHPHRRPYLLPQEVARLPWNKQLILRAGMLPIMADKIRWYADPEFRGLRMRAPVPPQIEIPVPLDDGGAIMMDFAAVSARTMEPDRDRDDERSAGSLRSIGRKL